MPSDLRKIKARVVNLGRLQPIEARKAGTMSDKPDRFEQVAMEIAQSLLSCDCKDCLPPAIEETTAKLRAAFPEPPAWSCGNGDHACNLRGYCVNPHCSQYKAKAQPVSDAEIEQAVQDAILKVSQSSSNEPAPNITKHIAYAVRSLISRAVEAALSQVPKHRALKSDLVGWYGRCSCQKPNEMPIDFETEDDYVRHLQDAAIRKQEGT